VGRDGAFGKNLRIPKIPRDIECGDDRPTDPALFYRDKDRPCSCRTAASQSRKFIPPWKISTFVHRGGCWGHRAQRRRTPLRSTTLAPEHNSP